MTIKKINKGLVDKKGNPVVEGAYIKLTGCSVKNDNGIYVVDVDENTNPNYSPSNSYILKKVKVDGTKAKAKYSIFFLDGDNPRITEKKLEFEVVTLEGLKQARKEVTAYLKGVTAQETIYTFINLENITTPEKLEKGMVIKFTKPVLLRGHINRFKGSYIIESVENGYFRLHLLGKKGKEITSQFNTYTMSESYYQGQPVTLSFTEKVMEQFFAKEYIVIQKRQEAVKGELKTEETKKNVEAEVKKAEKPEDTKKEPDNAGKLPVVQEVAQILPEETQKIEASAKENPEVQENTTTVRKYYAINEETAKYAKTVNSFRDYKPGEATEIYKYSCDKIYDILDKIRLEKPDLTSKAEGMADYYCRKLADYYNDYYRNEASCPSVMISGSANFPVRKKEKQNSRRESLRGTWEYLQNYVDKINNLLTLEQPILSKNKNAIELLQEKIHHLEQKKELMKDINKYYRKNKTIEGYEVEIPKDLLDHVNFIVGRGLGSFGLFNTTNINAEIVRLKERLESLQKTKEQGSEEDIIKDKDGNELFKIVKNTEIMRLQIIFGGKPSAEIRSILKSNGFRWSPHYGAWQRQLTNNALYALKIILEKIA